jgi:GH15 family glucan-1,4-alpha-glucosidase
VAALYQGLLTYSAILTEKGFKDEAAYLSPKAEHYRQKLENEWWDEEQALYHILL